MKVEKNTLRAVSKKGMLETITTVIDYNFAVFETAFCVKTNETMECFEGWSRTYSAAEKKGSSAKDINRMFTQKKQDPKYINIEREIVKIN